MKFYTLILLFVVTGSPALAANDFDIQLVRTAGETLRIQRVVTTETEVGFRIHGRLTANRAQYLPEGHVDIMAYNAGGVLIGKTTADIRPKALSRQAKRKGGVRFSGNVPENTPLGATIKLAYHRVEAGQSIKGNN
jgi:hypothetical protein